MGTKKCELCGGVARMFCESDEASLCWDCDGKVHGANFLVAKHTRCLLCSACQSPTPWKASGLRLGPTVSICESCVARKKNNSVVVAGRNQILTEDLSQEVDGRDFDGDRLRGDDGAESYEDHEEDEESDEDDEDEEEEEEEAENQVVPWDGAAAETSSSSSVSCGEEAFFVDGVLVVKKTRRCLDLNCSDEEESRPLKRLTRDETSSRSTAVMNSKGCDTSSSSSSLKSQTKAVDDSLVA
ncbi:unnamed protein product [Thlaspi arvense]|uniref:B box-type domain-containing protein n=1 Tax=Thlaspi arvense TaxID=13288 RepID=A0AAU9SSK6_THLAR|nr:unnamed protein product [Thlaspi arvense]